MLWWEKALLTPVYLQSRKNLPRTLTVRLPPRRYVWLWCAPLARWECQRPADPPRAATCSALTPPSSSKWTSESQPGTARCVTRLQPTTPSWLMGKACHINKPIPTKSCSYQNVIKGTWFILRVLRLLCCRYFQEVLNSSRLPADCSEIQLLADGSWTILSAKKETNTQNISPIVSHPFNYLNNKLLKTKGGERLRAINFSFCPLHILR